MTTARRAIESARRESRLRTLWRTLALIVFNTLLLIIALEAGLGLAGWLWNRFHRLDERETSPVFANQPWAAEYWREFYDIKTRYEPFVMWRNASLDGREIRIDAAGFRRTLPSAAAGSRVLFLGGSTMWGTGSPDSGTIPSCFARLEENAGRPLRVENYGQSGYVLKQEILALIAELQAGRVPDTVIFYDGVNEVFAAYQFGVPGLPQNNDQFARRMDLQPGTVLRELLAKSNLVRALQFAAYHFLKRESHRRSSGNDVTPENADSLARAVVVDYAASVQLLRHLSRAYGFQLHCFWQPVIFCGGKPLTAEEKTIVARQDPVLQELFRRTYGQLRESVPAGCADLSDVFDSAPQTLYIDFCHVGPEANELVAARMLALMHEVKRAPEEPPLPRRRVVRREETEE